MFDRVEKYRLAAKEWLEFKKASDLLSENKNDALAEIASKIDASSEAERNRLARLSQEWKDYKTGMLEAQHKERVCNVRKKVAEMEFDAARSENANARFERAQG